MKILVLAASHLHLGYLGCYGNAWVETPALDRLAAAGVVFDRHVADVPDPATARLVWGTGRYHFPEPSPLSPVRGGEGPGVRGAPQETSPLTPTPLPRNGGEGLISSLAAHGLTVSHLDPGADSLPDPDAHLYWIDLPSLLPPWDPPGEFLEHYFRDAGLGDDEEAEVAEEGESLTPLLDPGIGPLLPDDDALFLRIQSTYAAAVSLLDEQVERALERFRPKGLGDELLVVFTADSGLALGEHGVVGPCRPWLHEEVTHLPLIVKFPGDVAAGRRVFGLTQPADLLPTLLDALGRPPPADMHGHSLLPLARGEKASARDYAVSGWRIGPDVEWALRTPEWALLSPGDPDRRSPQLYVKPDDRWEVNNVLQHHLGYADRLAATLRAFTAAARQPGPLQPPPLPDPDQEGDDHEHGQAGA